MSTDREKDIFFAALELAPGARAAFLAEQCAQNDAMRARLERLLAAHTGAAEFMAAPTIDLQPRQPTPVAGGPDPEIGSQIGPYTLESVLGEGGFGRVFLARQRHPVTRAVALKVLKAGMDSRAIVGRFETERQALAVMDHPSVAKVLDGGQTAAGRPYFAMEYVRGEPITQFCRRKGLGLRERLELFEQVCLAVQHAHHKGLIHRDLKPSNVLVTVVDDRPVPKVIDFGIAKAIGAPTSGLTAMTLDGHLIGTPAYMSPEQLTSPTEMDTRSDVYTLGVLLYEILTGSPPFETARLERTPLASLAKIICDETPPKPSTRVLRSGESAAPVGQQAPRSRQLAGRLRGDLDWIVMRAMEKEPGRRYQTAAAMAADLRRFLRNEPVEAGPPSGAYRLRKLAQRRRVEFAAAGFVLLALVGGLISSLLFAARAEDQRRLTLKELEKSRAFAAFTTDMLRGLDPAVARGEDTALLTQMLGDARTRLERDAPGAPEVEAEIRELIGTAFQKIAALPEAEDQFTRALELARGSLGAEHATTLRIRQALALVHIEMTRLDEARAELTDVLDACTRTSGPESPEAISALFHLAEIDRLSGDYERARDGLERVVELRRRVLGDRNQDTMSARNSLATVLDELGDHELAIEMLRPIIDFQLEALGADHPNTLATQNNLANALQDVGRNGEAVEILEHILEVKRRIFEAPHPSLIVTLNNLSVAYRRAGRMDEAGTTLAEAVEMSRGALGERDMRTLILTGNLAGLLVRTDRAAQAAEMLESALPRCEEVLGREHPLALAMLSSLVGARLALGEPAAAATVAADLVARADKVFPAGHGDLVSHRRLWGEALLRSGEPARAEEVLREAIGMLDTGPEIDTASRRKTAALLAEACEAVGKAEEAANWRAVADIPEGG